MATRGRVDHPESGGIGLDLSITRAFSSRTYESLPRPGGILHPNGFGCLSGVEMARKLRPQAILLDVMMPSIDRWTVLTTLKADALGHDRWLIGRTEPPPSATERRKKMARPRPAKRAMDARSGLSNPHSMAALKEGEP